MKFRVGNAPGSLASNEELEHVWVVLSSLLLPIPYAGLRCPVATDDVQCDFAQKCRVARGRAVAHAAVVFAERNVQHPVERVLHHPVRADGLAQDGRTHA